ncbi:MAG: T9SS C-terminal target domain-containing protein [Bacteroidetes bacterium]|nr:MAG: T9SS C-terminal target domain-containing protein [Bacteroidota bacterium]
MKMRPILFLAYMISVVCVTAQTTLVAGDIAFTRYHQTTNRFDFVLLRDIAANTQIKFTDNGWRSAGLFRNGESELVWTTTIARTAGTYVRIIGTTPTLGTVTGTAMNFSNNGDQVFAFQGTMTSSPTLIAGLQMNGSWNTDATNSQTSSQPTALVTGFAAIAISPEVDFAGYDCSILTTGTANEIRTSVLTPGFWWADNSSVVAALQPTCSFSVTSFPIELLSFDVETEGLRADISWATAWETNNAFFSIERSLDGTSYESVSEIAGAGNSQSTIEYKSVDFAPRPGRYYYRLRQTDFDGMFTYSDVVEATFVDPLRAEVKVYPNPAPGEQLQVEVWGYHTYDVTLRLMNMQGKTLWTETPETSAGGIKTTAPLAGLPSGLYMLSAEYVQDGQPVRVSSSFLRQ